MLSCFPSVSVWYRCDSSKMAERIRELRRTIAHGFAYYYDFADDIEIKRCMIVMDHLIKCMNLQVAGFNEQEIIEFKNEVPFQHVRRKCNGQLSKSRRFPRCNTRGQLV